MSQPYYRVALNEWNSAGLGPNGLGPPDSNPCGWGTVLISKAFGERVSQGGRDFRPDKKSRPIRGLNPCSFRG